MAKAALYSKTSGTKTWLGFPCITQALSSHNRAADYTEREWNFVFRVFSDILTKPHTPQTHAHTNTHTKTVLRFGIASIMLSDVCRYRHTPTHTPPHTTHTHTHTHTYNPKYITTSTYTYTQTHTYSIVQRGTVRAF